MTEDDGQEDPEALLNAWLGELDTLTMVSLTFVLTIHSIAIFDKNTI